MNGMSKGLLAHIKYPYTAGIIAIIWIGMAIVLAFNEGANFELLIVATAVTSLAIAWVGFSSPKK